ncbi:MAG: hypothetical protein A3G34_14905 [Candidatus Lindowbacteria bacterium RIFCSPLOWO2_12_FULL_62_27]|nr:MAG: hypothetical protein A3I06_10190 [Candidatus Lindowbacteria bacterium RIFCSPLOWO2_02_FULL_62_12]OGH63144.1 MAG: hypothetical protein A3G34_14905 [Candidatus Lindowbacteria bacterium RIFCSPLOWO2_12_FULL_62_27]
MGSLIEFEVSGFNYDIGLAIGRAFRREIRHYVRHNNAQLATHWTGRIGTVQEALDESLARSARAFPRYVEELDGVAQGAGVPFRDIYALNYIELLEIDAPYTRGSDNCSTVAVPCNSHYVVGHNEDWTSGQNDVYVLRARYPTGGGFLALAYFGYLPGMSVGLNSHGIFHAINYLSPRDRRVGIPRTFITRAILDAPDFKTAIHIARAHYRSFGQSINLFRYGQFVNIETSAKRVAFSRPRGVFLHTNHYLHPDLIDMESPGHMQWTLTRYGMGRDYIARHPRFGARDIRRLLGSRDGAPFCFFCIPEPRNEHATLATAIFDTRRLALRVIRGNPARSRGRTYRLRG